ncbi:bifunctional diguanylate cyclase/phosphodiesterase [Asticcacaulis sp. SL142]|uniref:putative bifunctional diguanylate cyclase/phosphodiesterase n=1 Tax=Asticcacaulis sp. SL142 TaxID=2995155 RepID=UPI00226CF034|nr:bifunctional diguanylate cyclase/phosphodiesterase [Asticcacaulis sp. SL142]WAC48652.1 bifunctional diguanylate cyclase/phosphodiesterase [Asticcacaulis sp. SL142]
MVREYYIGDAVYFKLVKSAYGNLLPMLFVNVAAALGATWVLMHAGFAAAIYWFGGMIFLSLLRLAGLQRFNALLRRALITKKSDLTQWKKYYGVGLCSSGLLWVILACDVVLGVSGTASVSAKYTLIIIISSLAGGATGVTAALKREGRLYISILLLPASVALAVANSGDIVIAGLGIVFWVVMLVGHKNNHHILRQSYELQHENSNLIHSLRTLNSSLEAKVVERTVALKEIAHKDALTNLLNRRGLMEWAHQTLDENPGLRLAVLFLDLDRFKQVNDALGHDVGDHVLACVSRRIHEQLFSDSVMARWGGDEFVIAVPLKSGDTEHLQHLPSLIIEAAGMPVMLNGEEIKLGVSIGYAIYPDDDPSFTNIIQAADLAVAEVKRTERGGVLAYSETYAEVQRRRYDLSRALAKAIGTNELSLVYQPIVSAKTGRVVAQEALARWNHPLLGQISPDEFIRLAEDTDRINALGEWTLTEACRYAKSWSSDASHVKIAVNVSIKQMVRGHFDLKVVQILNATGLSPSRLQLEVTESVFDDEHMEMVLSCVKNLRDLGVDVHIDDFGTGYSSLSRLHRFQVGAVKIDRCFVNELSGKGRVVIESTVMIARQFGFEIIAEGVETVEQAKALYEIGVDEFQGYYFGRPQAEASHTAFRPVWAGGDHLETHQRHGRN